MEIWGGIECTVNRVRDRYFDQVVRTGHDARPEDLARFASLGIRAIRYPILWERTTSAGGFAWTDQRLTMLNELGVRPIAGLLHHGSGPRDMDLLDPAFPGAFAAYARSVAQRYPWLTEWTPINEPLTTARFSGLYGHWYPHAESDAAFVRMTLAQVRATAWAMAAVREVNPSALFLHTDDAGTVYATEPLVRQAEFENHRRDLALDLLFGRVDRHHPLWHYLVGSGATPDELAWFTANACPPDTIGANYYVTSDRVLDHRLARYPPETHGGNGRQAYADIAAVRASPPVLSGFAAVLERYWEKYRRPVALTEVHMGCTREEQLRWLAEAWSGTKAASARGVDVRAMCVWSLLGAYDWNRLVTEDAGDYESGVFDARSSPPRATALAAAVKSLATTGELWHDVLTRPGWWRDTEPVLARHERKGQRLLILGQSGTLGSALMRRCRDRRFEFLALGRGDVDITEAESVRRAVNETHPWAVINATGFVDVDRAEVDAEGCMAVNWSGARLVAEACSHAGARLVTFSSDLVFDGSNHTPYIESDPVAPLSTYGRSKVALEQSVMECLPEALVIRSSAFIDASDERTFTGRVFSAIANGQRIRTSSDIISPTYLPALADAVLDLLVDGECGVWHLANDGALSWTDLAQRLTSEVGADPELVEEAAPHELGRVARRPTYSALGSERGLVMPTLEQSLDDLMREREETLTHATA